ncbi:MAG: PilZ domain-containing protein [Novosphingobium sp.]|nr:PilZ domain-containing protein [Novosphingobium sp.]
MLHEKFDVSDPERARFDETRADVALYCEVRQSTRPWRRVRITDMSRTGFRIGRFPQSDPSLPLRIRIPGLALLNAQIRWRDKSAIGCEFIEPLHPAVFEHIVSQADEQLRFGL